MATAAAGGMVVGSNYGVGKDAFGNPISTNPTGSTPGAGYPGGTPSPTLPNPGSQAAADAGKTAVTGQPGGGGAAPYGSGGGPGSSYTVDPAGNASYTVTPNLIPQQTQSTEAINTQQNTAASSLAAQQAAAEQALEAEKAGLSSSAFTQRLGALQGLIGSGSGSPSPVTMGGTTGTGLSATQSPEEAAADAAAFARAKDLAGGNALAAYRGLQGAMSQQGLQGSTGPSLESGQLGDIIGGAAGAVNDFTRQQLISQLNRYANIADETYQGNITQRGQDLSAQNARLQALSGLINSGQLY